ncbi:oxidoreductase [Pseudooceanicola sp. LIPI14-2-Ac024]|uniref:oxidoreductase n=1 Tax=Pseudooceanicola sp. LIPI14-2-Ac024 TaxID=3344875 RepID=UPI0035D01B76
MLTVVVSGGDEHALDRTALEALPWTEFTTATIWTDGPQAFGGVAFGDLMDFLDIDPEHLTLVAANGYRVERAAHELQLEGALLAYERNGAPMSLRDKGPVWLVYNYDSDAAYRTEVTYANSIWQLDRIEITD